MLFGKLKLTSKLAVIIGAVLAAIFAVLIGVTISTTSASIQSGVVGELSALAKINGSEIQDCFDLVDDTAQSIQDYIDRIHTGQTGTVTGTDALQSSTLYPEQVLTSNVYDM